MPTIQKGMEKDALHADKELATSSAAQFCELGKTRWSVPVRRNGYNLWKRGMDLAISTFLLLLFFPIMLVAALCIYIEDRGPIFFGQNRVGRGGRLFKLYKFRTMFVDAEARKAEYLALNKHDGPIFKIENDPRITKVGRVLRRFSIDEMPQLINVFRGQMSIVGPRPMLENEVEHYDEWMFQRLQVKPGLTCYWQVMGRSNLTFEQWMELDRKYLEEMGFWTDIRIMLKTPAAVLRSDGAY